jgi:hypothetical protein
MGKIVTDTKDWFGKTTHTEVHTNRFEDFVINTVGHVLGRGREWRLVHWIEKRKLRRK